MLDSHVVSHLHVVPGILASHPQLFAIIPDGKDDGDEDDREETQQTASPV